MKWNITTTTARTQYGFLQGSHWNKRQLRIISDHVTHIQLIQCQKLIPTTGSDFCSQKNQLSNKQVCKRGSGANIEYCRLSNRYSGERIPSQRTISVSVAQVLTPNIVDEITDILGKNQLANKQVGKRGPGENTKHRRLNNRHSGKRISFQANRFGNVAIC